MWIILTNINYSRNKTETKSKIFINSLKNNKVHVNINKILNKKQLLSKPKELLMHYFLISADLFTT